MIIIDRFEGEYAVLETDGGMVDVNRLLLPENAREGDVLIHENGIYAIDAAATQERRERMRAMLNKLRRNG